MEVNRMNSERPLLRHLRFSLILISILCVTSTPAATEEESCRMWSGMAQKMAVERDAGVSRSVWNKRIDSLVGAKGVTDDNIGFMRGLLIAVYKDFKNKTPDELVVITYQACSVM
jgi:hypothetical protein